jgi:hypothetical protein
MLSYDEAPPFGIRFFVIISLECQGKLLNRSEPKKEK